jgi:hypothetical protein
MNKIQMNMVKWHLFMYRNYRRINLITETLRYNYQFNEEGD